MLFVSSVLDINQSLLYCLYIRLRVSQVAHLTLLHDYKCLISGQTGLSSPRDSISTHMRAYWIELLGKKITHCPFLVLFPMTSVHETVFFFFINVCCLLIESWRMLKAPDNVTFTRLHMVAEPFCRWLKYRKIVFKYWKYILNTLKSVSKYIWFGKGGLPHTHSNPDTL